VSGGERGDVVDAPVWARRAVVDTPGRPAGRPRERGLEHAINALCYNEVSVASARGGRLPTLRESGGTGRRTSLRGWRSQERGGSNPPFRTTFRIKGLQQFEGRQKMAASVVMLSSLLSANRFGRFRTRQLHSRPERGGLYALMAANLAVYYAVSSAGRANRSSAHRGSGVV
jgi:hypothetical protein